MRVTSLTADERRTLPVALLLVLGIRVALWVLPSRLIVRYVRSIAADSPVRRPQSAGSDVIVWAVSAASRRVPRATCLTQALAALLLLRRHGMDAELCLGAARGADGGFRAHAWVEFGGRIVIGGANVGGFYRFPAMRTSQGTPTKTPFR